MKMYVILSESFVRYENGKKLIRAEIAADTAADLPAVNSITGCKLAMGSVGWVIGDGLFYGLNSSGEWVCQTEAE